MADTEQMDSIGASFPTVSLSSAFNSGAATIASSAQQLGRDAQQIASPDGQGLTNSLLDLNQVGQLSQAGADVIRTSNQMLGTLLNAFA
jgi:hypothetical protein